ncbi:glycosyltransferase family 4 protein [Dyella flagellata]
MRMLWALPYLPWPTTSGGKLRQYHLLRELAARGHRITLLAQSKIPLDDAARHALEPLLDRLIVLPRRPLKSFTTMAAALLSPLPLLATVNGYAAPLQRRFEQLLDERWDIVQIEHSYALQPYARSLEQRRQPFLLSEHNIESQLGNITYQRLPAALRPLARLDNWRYRRWEQRALHQAQQVIAVTEADATAFRALTPRPVRVAINGVDVQAAAHVRPDVHTQRILYVGNFEYAPNVDAVEWAVQEIMPRVWATRPKALLCVCGYALPERWRRHMEDPRIEWLGYVKRLDHVQAQASAFLAPLRDGGGSKLKVLEAMAAGLPLVSTAQGVSGLNVREGIHYRRGDHAAALAQALIELLQAPEQAVVLGEAGRRYVREQHDWRIAADQLEAAYREHTACA